MKSRLLHPDSDFDTRFPEPWNAGELVRDLGLETLFAAMANEDEFIGAVVRNVLLAGWAHSPFGVEYRQRILQDCLRQPTAARALYAIAVEAAENAKGHYLGRLAQYPDWVLRISLEELEVFMGFLAKLRKFSSTQADVFTSPGWSAFFARLDQTLNDAFFADAVRHLHALQFRKGIMLGADLGPGNRGKGHHVLPLQRRPPRTIARRLLAWIMARIAPKTPPCSFSLHPRDESGARALTELKNRGLAPLAVVIAQVADGMRGFFTTLRAELAFYVGCLNLHDRLAELGLPSCMPTPLGAALGELSFRGLHDPCLALHSGNPVVGNDAELGGRLLVLITGANQGGKTTFLRSLGVAQTMMQCGMFVSAEAFTSSLCGGLFTHFKREEDAALKSGKLDEELARMDELIDHVAPRAMVLLNESFAATNEREGSEIARQIVIALAAARIRVCYVTHLHELTRGFYEREPEIAFFLRAERDADGRRTFRLREGEPLATSYAEDLFEQIFGAAAIGHDAKAMTEDPRAGSQNA